MPVVPYYLGQSARVWITAMSRRNSAWQAREGGGNDRSLASGALSRSKVSRRMRSTQAVGGKSIPDSGSRKAVAPSADSVFTANLGRVGRDRAHITRSGLNVRTTPPTTIQ